MNYTNIKHNGSITPDRIACFEEKIACGLPFDYRNFLMAYNGGKTLGSFLGIVDVGSSADREVDVDYFLGLDLPDVYYDLDYGLGCDRYRTGIDYSKYIIVARGSAQIVYRLCLLPEHFGVIFFDDQNFDGQVFRMADSWNAFIKMLYLNKWLEI